MRLWPALVAALVVSGGCVSVPVTAERSEVIRRILPSTVQLRSEREGGGRRAASGVVLASDPDGRSWILTTRHFLEPATPQRIYVRPPGREGRIEARVVRLGDGIDLAVIVVDGIAFPPVTLKYSVQLGDEVWVVGFPWGRRVTVVSGVVSQVSSEGGEAPVEGPPRMVDASVSYGGSGGGVFDASSGALIGIVEGYRTVRVTVQTSPERVVDVPVPGETTLVPAAAIRRFLADAGLETLIGK